MFTNLIFVESTLETLLVSVSPQYFPINSSYLDYSFAQISGYFLLLEHPIVKPLMSTVYPQ